jgi:hypothetical protein
MQKKAQFFKLKADSKAESKELKKRCEKMQRISRKAKANRNAFRYCKELLIYSLFRDMNKSLEQNRKAQ